MSAACRAANVPPVDEAQPGATSGASGVQIAPMDLSGDFTLFADAIVEVSPGKRPLFLAYLSKAWHEAADLALEVYKLRKQLAALQPPSPRENRLHLRDEAIRAAFMQAPYAGLSPTAAAKELARALGAYLSGGWLRERDLDHLPNASEHRQTLHRIAKLNGGHSLGPRQIINIRDGFRSY